MDLNEFLKFIEKDNFLRINNSKSKTVFSYNRASRGKFSYDSKFAFFSIKPWKDSITELKRKKVKKNKLPKDSLGIYDLKIKSLTKIGNIKSYKTPLKWSGYVAYQFEINQEKKDAKKKNKKAKKVSKENGYHLVLINLASKKRDTFAGLGKLKLSERRYGKSSFVK